MLSSVFSYYHTLVQWLFTRLYHEFAWLYDHIAALVSWGHWDDWVVAIADQVHGDVLELGCGTGYLQAELGGRSPAHLVIGLDLSPQMLRLSQQRSQKLALPLHVLRANAQQIALVPQRFDTIVATFPSDYILQAATLAEVQRLLRPHGRFVVLLSASLPGPGWYRSLVELAYKLTLQAGSKKQAIQPESDELTPMIMGHYQEQALVDSLQQRLYAAGLEGRSFILESHAGQLFGIIAQPIS